MERIFDFGIEREEVKGLLLLFKSLLLLLSSHPPSVHIVQSDTKSSLVSTLQTPALLHTSFSPHLSGFGLLKLMSRGLHVP